MNKLIVLISVLLFVGCDKRIDIRFNENNGEQKHIITDCGTIRLSFSTMGGTYILSCMINARSQTKVSADYLKILVNGKVLPYNLWVNNEQVESFNFNVEESIRLGYSFIIPREFGKRLEFEIFASEQFLQQQEGAVKCGFSSIIVIFNR